ncbi:hypothetical protein [Paragemmobacter ruber]|uniref:Uncharacterized protein n=1 Tax=Paragemmobacter ruber TaxID=1985673 RepID=A0ABW9YBI6_9RHOB|nr:hypothetical protein [Rhodobacter ruber]NBE09215.1 hypothetical protein [Rhodobacter ruber]
MFKVLVKTILQDCNDTAVKGGPLAIDKAELQALFRDDFADHAMLVRSRKAARQAQLRLAA